MSPNHTHTQIHTQSHPDTPIDKNTHTHALSHMYLYFSGPVYSGFISQKFPTSFVQTFYLLVILELQKSFNDNTKRSPITFTQLPLMLTSLHNCGIFLKTMKHQCSTINQTKDFIQISPVFPPVPFFLFWDSIQGTMLHLVIMSS